MSQVAVCPPPLYVQHMLLEYACIYFNKHTLYCHILSAESLEDAGYESRKKQEIFLFSKASKPSLRSIQSPIKYVTGAFP